MKRIKWIPVIVSAVLLMIAIPVFGDDILGYSIIGPSAGRPITSPPTQLQFDDGWSEFDVPTAGRGCEAETGEIANPF